MLVIIALIAFVQIVCGSFYYVGGSTNTGLSSVYPPDTPAMPASRHSAATWSTVGWMWSFGGATSTGALSDMWKLSTSTNVWTFVGGPQTSYVYGKYDSSTGTAWPGGRWGAYTWTDGVNLFLFGGVGCAASTQGSLNDLWKYSTTTNTWQFLKGPTTANHPGNYTSTDPIPYSRSFGVSWMLNNNQLFLIGGQTMYGYMNDMWQFNLAANKWTWMQGSSGISQEPIVSGPFAQPGARGYAVGWMDTSTGSAWLYGGFGVCKSSDGTWGSSYLSDLWEYSSTGWHLRSGNVSCDVATEYNGVSPHPGGRYRALAMFDRTRHQFLLFGGNGYGSSGAGDLSDFWAYAVASNTWSFIGGTSLKNQYGVYSGLNEYPGGRFLALGVADLVYDRFWLWGGAGYALSSYGLLSDLWLILL